MINGGIINFNGGAGGSSGSSSGVTSLGVAGGADLTGAIDLTSVSGFITLGDNGGSSPISIDVNVHALSGLWSLTPSGGSGGGAIDSIGVVGGADLTGAIDFTDPSGFIVWGDDGGASPIFASIDTHALSGLWDLNQININKLNMAASGQVILNELAVSGQVLFTEINTKADQVDLDASGQVLLSNDAASGQVLWSELKGSGQLLLTENNASGQYLQNILNVSGQVLLGNDNASGQVIWSELKGSGQLLLSNDAASGQILLTEINSLLPTTADQVEVNEIGTSTYDDVQDYINNVQSSLIIDGGVISENAGASGTIDITVAKGMIKTTSSASGAIVSFDLASVANMVLASSGLNYINIDYNGGTPQFTATTGAPNHTTVFPIGYVYEIGHHLEIVNGFHEFTNLSERVNHALTDVWGFQRAFGLVTTESGSEDLYPTVTAGEVYGGMIEFDIPAYDSSKEHDITGGGSGGTISANNTIVHDSTVGDVTGDYIHGQNIRISESSNSNNGSYHVESVSWDGSNTTIVIEEVTLNTGADTGHVHPKPFSYWYRDGGTGWIQTEGQGAIDNTQYDDDSGSLATLTPNRYGVHWVYMSLAGSLHVIYGQDDYTLSNAIDSSPPSTVPDIIDKTCLLIARIIIKKDATSWLSVSYPWTTVFSTTGGSVHNELGGLQGGSADSYFHLTEAQRDNVITLPASGQVLLNELAASGQVLLSNDAASGQVTLNVLNASGQYLWSELKGSGQLLLSDVASSGQLLLRKADSDLNGFPDRNRSTLSFDHGTRTLSIQPTGSEFNYYVRSAEYISNGDTYILPNEEGVHFIYYDGPTISGVVNPSIPEIDILIKEKTLISIMYWGTNQSSGIYLGEERHGISMSPTTHAYLHFVNGLEYFSGLGLNSITADGNGNADDYAVFGIDSGLVADEDIDWPIGAVPSGNGCPIYFMTGVTPEWNKVDPSGFSVRTFDQTRNTRLAYNEFTGGAWQLTEVGNNRYVLCHIFATTAQSQSMLSIMGQSTYVTKPAAQAGAKTEIHTLVTDQLLFPETRPIATVIFQTGDGYTNQVKGAIVSTEDGDDYIDWRDEIISRTALTTSDHNALNGLQGGAGGDYFHLTEAQRDNVITLPASGQVLLNEMAVSGQLLLGNDAASGQVMLTELNVSGQTLLENTASSGQVLLTEIGNISGITSEGMMVLNAAQSATISGQDVYIRAGAHVGAGSIHNKCRNTFLIGDQVSSPKDDEGTPWDIIEYTRHGIYLRPNTYFVVGDGTQGQWSPIDIFIYSGNTIKLFPSGSLEIGNSNFIDNTPDNIDFYGEDRFKARIKNTYANNYEYGIDISSDNIALTTVPGNRPTINTSGIALLDDVLGSGQAVVTSIGIIGDNDLHGDIDFQTKASGFMGITRTGKELPNTIRITDSDVVLYYYFDSAPTSGVAIPNRAAAADPNTDLDWYSIPGGNYFDGAGLYGAEVNAGDPDGQPLQWGGRNPYAASGNLSDVAHTDIAYYDKWRNVKNWEANNISAAWASGDFSFGMWFKFVDQNNDIVNAALLNFASVDNSLNYGYYLDVDLNGIVSFRKQENGLKAVVTSDTAVSGAAGVGEAYWWGWNHLAITASRTADGNGNYAYMYLNGIEVGSSSDADWAATYSAGNVPKYLTMGGILRNLTYYDSAFAFRDFWIMDRIITEGEVNYIFNNDIAKEALVANDLQFNVDHNALSGLWQLDRVVQNAEDLKGSGQLLLTENNASGQYMWNTLNVSGQALLGNDAASGQVVLNELNVSGQVLLQQAGGVSSVGVEGGAAITGAAEFAAPSGFIVWGDTAGANPITADLDFHALSGTYKDSDAYIYLQGSAAALNPTSGTDYTTLNLLSGGSMYRFRKNIYHLNNTQNIYFGVSGIYAITACLGTNHNVVATQNGIIGHYSVNAGTYGQIGNSLRQMQVATTAANQIVINYLLRVEAGDFINFQGNFSSADPGSLYLPNQVGVTIHRVCEGDILLEEVLP